MGGYIIWILGAFLIECKFVFSKGIDKNSLICLLIFTVLVAAAGKSLANGWLYRDIICFTKDLSYVNKNLYNEKVEKLDYIYKTKSVGKTSTISIILKTENNEYQLMDNIVTKSTYEEFRSKFKKGDKVKIKYLPNTELVLSVEKLDE